MLFEYLIPELRLLCSVPPAGCKKKEISVDFEIIMHFFRYYDKVYRLKVFRLKERPRYTWPSASKPGLRAEPAVVFFSIDVICQK